MGMNADLPTEFVLGKPPDSGKFSGAAKNISWPTKLNSDDSLAYSELDEFGLIVDI